MASPSKRYKISVLALLVSTIVAGCGPLVKFGDSSPPSQLFTLAYQPPGNPIVTKPIDCIRLEALDMPSELARDRIAVRVGVQQVQYIKDARWSGAPGEMLGSLLSEGLHLAGAASVLTAHQIDLACSLRLVGHVQQFAIFDGERAKVQVEFMLVASKGNRILGSQVLAADVKIAGERRPADMAAGLNSAANSVVAEAIRWIDTTRGR